MTPALRILWIDLRRKRDTPTIKASLGHEHKVTTVNRIAAAVESAGRLRPHLACAEFDYPDEVQLRVVPEMTQQFSLLPLLMFTEYHSEALAVWAFRSGVSDYRVKPVDPDVVNELVALFGGKSCRNQGATGNRGMPPRLLQPGGHLLSPPMTTIRTAPAVAYITMQYRERISQQHMASLCNLSPSEFSRVFQREHEYTFERFLLTFRIARAQDPLLESKLTITQVAHSVGFNDSSYFARAFRQLAGTSASEWRRRGRASSPHDAA